MVLIRICTIRALDWMQLTHRRDHPSCGGKGGSSCQKLVTSELSHLFLSQAAEVRLMDSPSGPCVDPTILVAPPRGCHVQEGSLNDFDFSPPLLVSEIPHCYRRLNNSTLSCFPSSPPLIPPIFFITGKFCLHGCPLPHTEPL